MDRPSLLFAFLVMQNYKLDASTNIDIDGIQFDAGIVNRKFVKFNPPSNFPAIRQ